MEGFMSIFRTFLLAVVVVVGAVCLSGCKTKQEKLVDGIVGTFKEEDSKREKWRNKAREAGMYLMAYESAVLAAVSEKGNNFTIKDLGLEPKKDGTYFTYTVSDDGISCTATARKSIGDFDKGSTITTKYDKVKQNFVRSSSQHITAKILLPTFFVEQDDDDDEKSTTPPPAQSVQTSAPIKNAKSPAALVPTGYKILEEVKGDLNKDDLEDYVFDIQDESSRGIVIAFNKGGDYEKVLENRSIYGGMSMTITIKKGILGIVVGETFADGNRHEDYKFRFQNSDFELIGYDYYEKYGESVTNRSMNLLANKMQTKEDGDEKWNSIVIKEPIKLRKINNFEEFDVTNYITVK
jgi:hypothetical protein